METSFQCWTHHLFTRSCTLAPIGAITQKNMKFSIILLVAVPLVATSVVPDTFFGKLKPLAASLKIVAEHTPVVFSDYEQVAFKTAQVQYIANELTELARQMKTEANQPNPVPAAYKQETQMMIDLAEKFETLAENPTELIADFQKAASQLTAVASMYFGEQPKEFQDGFENLSRQMFELADDIDRLVRFPYETSKHLFTMVNEIKRISTETSDRLSQETPQEIGNIADQLANQLTEFERISRELAVIPSEKVVQATYLANKFELVAEELNEIEQAIAQWAGQYPEFQQATEMEATWNRASELAKAISIDLNEAAGQPLEAENKDG